MAEILFADLETFSEADLKKVGSYRYAEDPTTEILLFPYAIDDGPALVYDATTGERPPRELMRALRKCASGKMKLVGQNFLMFDRKVLDNCWGISIPVEHIHDTMIAAYRQALPGNLDMLCKVLGLENQKNDKGKALINRFCKPAPKNHKAQRYTRKTHPELWDDFIEYARDDITSMRDAYYATPQWNNSEMENLILAIDQRINDRGFFVDMELALAAITADAEHKAKIKSECQSLFGCSPTGAQFLPALRRLAPAFSIPNAQKSTMRDLLKDKDFPEIGKKLIKMRMEASSTAATKYTPLVNGSSSDGRRRGTVQYGGAKRTLRWAGRGFQPQNLAQGFFKTEGDDEEGTKKLIAKFARALKAMRTGIGLDLYNVHKLTVSGVRPCIIPAPGKKFCVADYSNVEGRGLAWAAGETTALDTFIKGLDIYKVTAGKMFGMSPEQIDKALRQIGKACLHRHTQVLTNEGFKDIVAVSANDKLWNGIKWVSSDGVKLMGWKPLINVDGVAMTEDHRILTSSWKEAKQLASSKSTLTLALAKGSVAWSCFANFQNERETSHYSRNATAGQCPRVSIGATSEVAKLSNATFAHSKPLANIESNISVTRTQCPTMRTEPDYSIGYPRPLDVVTTQEPKVSKTMVGEVSRSVKVGRLTSARSLAMFKLLKAGTIQISKWIEPTTTKAMNLGILGLSAVQKTRKIGGEYPIFNGVMMKPLPGLLNLNGKLTYCEPVYDLINVAEGNRFLIKSGSGFLVSHNCELGLGYGGGVSAFLQFAKVLGLDLVAMAETMDGTFPDHIWNAAIKGYEFARIQEKNKRAGPGEDKPNRPSYDLPKKVWLTCDSIKRLWRESHPKTVQLWNELESAAMQAIKNPGKSFWAGANVRPNGTKAFRVVRTRKNGEPGWWLKIELPSGRFLCYPGIGLTAEKDPVGGKVQSKISYMGENQMTRRWEKQFTYGGKLTENVIQALCRDVLAWSMPGVEHAGYEIVLSVHDELITEVPDTDDYSSDELCELMCDLPDWAIGFPLKAEGTEMMFYRK